MLNTLGDKLVKAMAKKDEDEIAEIKKEVKGGNLPSLDGVKVVELTDEEMADRAKGAKKRQAWVKEAAGIVVMARKTVVRLTALMVEGPLSTEDKGLLVKTQEVEKDILRKAKAADLEDHLKKSVFLESIRKADANADTVSLFTKLSIEAGHYRMATFDEGKKLSKRGSTWPKGTTRYHGQFYLPCFEEDKSAYQMALEAELCKLIRRTVSAEKKVAKERLVELEVNPVGDPLNFKRRQLGTYSFYFPAGEHKEAGRKWTAGAVVVRIKEKTMGRKDKRFTIQVIEIVETVGRFAWLNQYVGEYVPFKWYADQRIPETAPVMTLEFAEFLTKKLYKAVGFALKAKRVADFAKQEQEEEAKKTETDEAVKTEVSKVALKRDVPETPEKTE